MTGFVDFKTLEVYGIVKRSFELLGTKIQRIHDTLGIPQGKFWGRKLQYIPRITGRKAEGLSPFHHQFSQAESHIDNAIFGFFISDWIVVEGSGHSRNGGEEIAAILGSTHILDHHSHLLFAQEVGAGLYISSTGGKIDRCIDTFDRLAQQTEHLILIFRFGDHIGRIDSRKWLIMGIFQFGTGSNGQWAGHRADISPQIIDQRLG